MCLALVLAIVFVASPGWASSRTAAQAAATPAVPAPATQASPAGRSVPPDQRGTTPFSYMVDGRRDPFANLVGAASDAKTAPRRNIVGIGGIRIDELSVRGIMQSRERLVGMVQGPDNRTYLVHQGDKLSDGVVKSITPQGLVLVQDVGDPRAKEKTREVRKLMRSPEDEKE